MKQQKRELRFFTVPEWEEEQAYLRRRHQEGWRFTYVCGLVYHFEACIPQDVIYQLDYNPEGRRKVEYLQMFQDCGWEYLQDFAGYSYFRKPAADMGGQEEAIFCDTASRLDMMNRVFKGRILPLLVIFLCIIVPQIFMQLHNTSPAGLVFCIVFCVMAVLYLQLFLRFFLRYQEVRGR